VEEVPP